MQAPTDLARKEGRSAIRHPGEGRDPSQSSVMRPNGILAFAGMTIKGSWRKFLSTPARAGALEAFPRTPAQLAKRLKATYECPGRGPQTPG